jgi:hypothetical protein
MFSWPTYRAKFGTHRLYSVFSVLPVLRNSAAQTGAKLADSKTLAAATLRRPTSCSRCQGEAPPRRRREGRGRLFIRRGGGGSGLT